MKIEKEGSQSKRMTRVAVLGGLSDEQNLLNALTDASFRSMSSYDQICQDFASGKEGVICWLRKRRMRRWRRSCWRI